MTNNFKKIKEFWKKLIEDQQWKCGFDDEEFSRPNWKEKIDQTKTFKELDELGRELRREVVSKVYVGATKELMVNEEKKYVEHTLDALSKYKKKIYLLKNQDDVSKTTINDYENSIKEFQNKIKSIVGNDLTNWESKIVEKGMSDRNIADLQEKIDDLTTNFISVQAKRDEVDKELKEKRQQILDHKCDSLDNVELNQLKDELKKAIQEKDQLQTELNKKNPNPQTPQQKEEKENQNLIAGELREKIKFKNDEIRKAKENLSKLNEELNQTKGELDKASQKITSLKMQLKEVVIKEEKNKEEQENNNLTLEQLKEKLLQKRKLINDLQRKLSQAQQNKVSNNRYLVGRSYKLGNDIGNSTKPTKIILKHFLSFPFLFLIVLLSL